MTLKFTFMFLITLMGMCRLSHTMELTSYDLTTVLTELSELGDWGNDLDSPLTKNVDKLQELLTALEALDNDGNNYTVEYLVESNGYPIETHYVTTSDGYILALHRIPGSPNTNSSNGKVAFLQHGLICSSADWLLLGSGKSLGFLLADEGYDVWLGNARGNTWSRNHTTLSPDSAAFWQFTWHQIGIYDMPAMIDYVLENTNVSSVYYAGHSQGTTVYYVMLSILPEYNSKIKVGASLAPIAFFKYMTSPLFKVLALFQTELSVITSLIGLNEFLPTSAFFKYILGDAVCAEDAVTQFLCTDILFSMFGFDYAQINTTFLPIMLKYTPAGASTKQFLHYAQEINSGRFQLYSYDAVTNLLKYGSITPPNYDLTKIVAPSYLYWSTNDWLSAGTDVKNLCIGMGNACREMIQVNYPAWNHMDYLYAIDVVSFINGPVIELFNSN